MLNRHALVLERGDPGLFDVFKRITRGAIGFATGGPGGALRGLISPTRAPRGIIDGGRPPRLPPVGTVVRPGGGVTPIINIPGVKGILQRAIPGGATGLGVPGAVFRDIAGISPVVGGGCPSGFHPNKSSYFTQAGFVPQGSKCVRNRRRNLSNGRANTRSLRRMAAWDKQERRLGKTLKAIARGR